MHSNAENITKAIVSTDGRVLIEQSDGSYREAKGQTDWEKMDAMSEADIEESAAEDMQELGIDPDWMENATPVYPPQKERITMRLDSDMLQWFRARGKGYQTFMNAVLRSYYESQKQPRHH